jgi:hypothetical protein
MQMADTTGFGDAFDAISFYSRIVSRFEELSNLMRQTPEGDRALGMQLQNLAADIREDISFGATFQSACRTLIARGE